MITDFSLLVYYSYNTILIWSNSPFLFPFVASLKTSHHHGVYGELFLVLQTQPEYIAKLTRLVSQKGIDGMLSCLSVRPSLFKPSTYMYLVLS